MRGVCDFVTLHYEINDNVNVRFQQRWNVNWNVNPPEVTGSGMWLYVEPLSGMHTHARHTKQIEN